jgi:hypothetical protein
MREEAELRRQQEAKRLAEGSVAQVRHMRDAIFGTIELSERQAQGNVQDRELFFKTSINNESDEIDEDQIPFPAASAIAVVAGAQTAEQWNKLNSQQREEFRAKTTDQLTDQVIRSHFEADRLMHDPLWRHAAHAFINDEKNNGGGAIEALKTGLPPHILQSTGGFTVEVLPRKEDQIGAIVHGTLHRLHKLCTEDRNTVRNEMVGWERWRNQLRSPTLNDIPGLINTYKDVQIPYEWFADLTSRTPEIRDSALDRIRKLGGFIHPPYAEDYEEMINHGVAKMTNDGSAYYGALTDPEVVREHLRQMCGLEDGKMYTSINDLPLKSAKGWPLEWNADPAYALEMFQSPHNVAVSVEVAVKKEEKANGNGKRRNAGLAAALKDGVYREVSQPWVLTRHFQLMKVEVPEMGRGPELVSGAINVGSDVFIRMLGGREIGSAKEECTVMAPDSRGSLHPVKLTIRWIFCLAPRRTSLDAIEGRGHRT